MYKVLVHRKRVYKVRQSKKKMENEQKRENLRAPTCNIVRSSTHHCISFTRSYPHLETFPAPPNLSLGHWEGKTPPKYRYTPTLSCATLQEE